MTCGSLCSGIGGLDLAIQSHYGATISWHSETDTHASAVLARWWPDVPNLGDLYAVNWDDVPRVDVLCAGYPCQPFSMAGKRAGADDERHLWDGIAAAVRVLRPGRVVLENVPAVLAIGGFGQVLGDLADAGMDARWMVLHASDVGACHKRARLFVVATSAAADAAVLGRTARRGRREGEASAVWSGRPDEHDRPAADAADADQSRLARPIAGQQGRREGAAGPVRNLGPYAAAIRRWEQASGRRAPAATNERGQLSAPFVEWMMGLPDGWTDQLSRGQALRVLGNAVVPAQAAAALVELDP